MPILNFALILVFVFSGLFAGAFLAYNSPEEMKTGRRYFQLMQKIILVIVSLIVIRSLGLPAAVSLILYAAAILAFSLVKVKTTYTYPLLGAVLFYFYMKDAFLAMAGLALLYGFPSGSLFVIMSKDKLNKTIAKITAYHSGFFIAPALIYLLSAL